MTLLENADSTVKEFFRYFEKPVGEASFDELPVLLKLLPRPLDAEFVYVVVQGKDMVMVLIQMKPNIMAYLLDSNTMKSWVENKFERYCAFWSKAQKIAELVLEVHRTIRTGGNNPAT